MYLVSKREGINKYFYDDKNLKIRRTYINDKLHDEYNKYFDSK